MHADPAKTREALLDILRQMRVLTAKGLGEMPMDEALEASDGEAPAEPVEPETDGEEPTPEAPAEDDDAERMTSFLRGKHTQPKAEGVTIGVGALAKAKSAPPAPKTKGPAKPFPKGLKK
ncbi:MAG TPA: hypothetical protein VEB22_12325 [Phycisphaerales bacterium]|nr:hypothetical protein [Phycisphaerales bacterium]